MLHFFKDMSNRWYEHKVLSIFQEIWVVIHAMSVSNRTLNPDQRKMCIKESLKCVMEMKHKMKLLETSCGYKGNKSLPQLFEYGITVIIISIKNNGLKIHHISPLYPQVPHQRIQLTTDRVFFNSRKQNLNLQCTNNYLHSIYIVLGYPLVHTIYWGKNYP